MIERILIKATAGRQVRDPGTDQNLPEGVVVEVTDSPYWRRRQVKGDIELVHAEPEQVKRGGRTNG